MDEQASGGVKHFGFVYFAFFLCTFVRPRNGSSHTVIVFSCKKKIDFKINLAQKPDVIEKTVII